MKNFLLSILASSLFFTSYADILEGGNISFAYTGVPNQYIVKMILYRDCSGIPFPSSDTICVSSVHCNYSSFVIVSIDSIVEINNCFNTIYLGPTSCNGGTQYGVEKHSYSGQLILPFACDDWELAYSKRRPPIITINPKLVVIKTRFDNLNFPGNSSPAFSDDPCFEGCILTNLCYSLAATDLDGDPINYFEHSIDTSSSGGCPQVYAYDSNPINVTQYSQLDSTSGLFCFNVPLIMSAIVPYAVSDLSGNSIKSTIYAYNLLSISNNNICVTGIEQVSNELNFTLLPNSADNYIQLSFFKPITNSVTVNLYNVLGEKVKMQKANNQTKVTLSTFELRAGIYLVEVVQGSYKRSARFVKE